jgi:hypothetical protein
VDRINSSSASASSASHKIVGLSVVFSSWGDMEQMAPDSINFKGSSQSVEKENGRNEPKIYYSIARHRFRASMLY